MKRFLATILPALLLVVFTGIAQAEPSAAHPRDLSGKVVALDTGHSVTIKNDLGKETVIDMSAKTAVEGGKLAVGEKVNVRTREQNGKRVAVRIKLAK